MGSASHRARQTARTGNVAGRSRGETAEAGAGIEGRAVIRQDRMPKSMVLCLANASFKNPSGTLKRLFSALVAQMLYACCTRKKTRFIARKASNGGFSTTVGLLKKQ
jgi:hypothetical protein